MTSLKIVRKKLILLLLALIIVKFKNGLDHLKITIGILSISKNSGGI